MPLSKNCIFNTTKICNDCGECYICDLDKKKRCNNCGKCLELEGVDIRAIKIEEIMEKSEPVEETVAEEEKTESCSDILKETELSEDDAVWEYIDDIKDLNHLLKDENLDNTEDITESYPGLITYNKK